MKGRCGVQTMAAAERSGRNELENSIASNVGHPKSWALFVGQLHVFGARFERQNADDVHRFSPR